MPLKPDLAQRARLRRVLCEREDLVLDLCLGVARIQRALHLSVVLVLSKPSAAREHPLGGTRAHLDALKEPVRSEALPEAAFAVLLDRQRGNVTEIRLHLGEDVRLPAHEGLSAEALQQEPLAVGSGAVQLRVHIRRGARAGKVAGHGGDCVSHAFPWLRHRPAARPAGRAPRVPHRRGHLPGGSRRRSLKYHSNFRASVRPTLLAVCK